MPDIEDAEHVEDFGDIEEGLQPTQPPLRNKWSRRQLQLQVKPLHYLFLAERGGLVYSEIYIYVYNH